VNRRSRAIERTLRLCTALTGARHGRVIGEEHVYAQPHNPAVQGKPVHFLIKHGRCTEPEVASVIDHEWSITETEQYDFIEHYGIFVNQTKKMRYKKIKNIQPARNTRDLISEADAIVEMHVLSVEKIYCEWPL
jgi:hypothetical protein